MGRKPKAKGIKEYLDNPRTRFSFSSPLDFRECFGDMSERYLTPATNGKRLSPQTFRIVVHLKNSRHGDKEVYLSELEKGGKFLWNAFLAPNAPFPCNPANTPKDKLVGRIRWDAGSYDGAHFKTQTDPSKKRGKTVEFFLSASKTNPNGAMVNGSTYFPSLERVWVPLKANTTNKKAVTKADGSKGYWRRTEKLVACPVSLGGLWVSKSKAGQFKFTLDKPKIGCGPGFIARGQAPKEFGKFWEPSVDDPKIINEVVTDVTILPLNAESTEFAADEYRAFYEAQGYDMDNLLEIQDVEIMDSETEQQAIERAYYNPSEAMVGTDETLDGYRPIDSATVDLTSNQPMANYGAEGKKRMMCAECGSYDVRAAEGESATYAPSNEPDMVSSSDFDEPTNANYSAEGETVADVEASVEPANEPIAVAEGTSLDGYAPLDSLEEGAPIGHGVNQYFGSAETSFAMEGTEGALLDESTTNIGIEEGVSLDNFSGVDSVVVEAPLGHGVTQWFSENYEGPLPEGPSDIPEPADATGSHPSNEYMRLEAEFNAMDRAERKKVMKKYGRKAFVEPDTLGWPIMNLEGNDGQAKIALNYSKWKNNKDDRTKVRRAVFKQFPHLKAYASEHHKGQGYDDEEHESLGMRHRGPHEQSLADRSDEAYAMDKRHSRMHRKYDNVMAMDAESKFDKLQKQVAREEMEDHPKMSREKAMDIGGGVAYDAGVKKYDRLTDGHGKEVMEEAARKGIPAARVARNFEAIEFGRGKGGRFSGRKYVRDDKKGTFLRQGADTAGYLQDGSVSMDGYTPLESVEVDRSSYQPTQNYGAEFEADGITGDHPFVPAVKTGAGFAVGFAIPGLLLGTAAMLAMGLLGNKME